MCGKKPCEECKMNEYLIHYLDRLVIEELEKHLKGRKKHLKKLVKGGIDFAYPVKKAFQLLSNQYRKRFCNGKARPLEVGEIHPLCANFMGPGTRIDLEKVKDYPAYNEADECAKEHDLLYLEAQNEKDPTKKANIIREADDKIIECLKKVIGNAPYKQIGMAGIESKMKLEDLIPQLISMIAPDYFGKKK